MTCPIFSVISWFLVNQLVVFAAKARQSDAVAVAALDSYLENLKFWLKVILHNRNCFQGF